MRSAQYADIIIVVGLLAVSGITLFQWAVNYTQPLPPPTQTKVIKLWTENKLLRENFFLSTPEGVFDISREEFSRITPGQPICLTAEKRTIALKPDVRVTASKACR